MVERFNQTIKKMLTQDMLKKRTSRYIDFLQKTVTRYNNKIHSTIGMTPSFAHFFATDLERKSIVFKLESIYNKSCPFIPTGEHLPVGIMKDYDPAKTAKEHAQDKKKIFTKGYKPQWSEDTYTIIEKIIDRHHGETMQLNDVIRYRVDGVDQTFYHWVLKSIN